PYPIWLFSLRNSGKVILQPAKAIIDYACYQAINYGIPKPGSLCARLARIGMYSRSLLLALLASVNALSWSLLVLLGVALVRRLAKRVPPRPA
ncbi:MAG TPA: hypothetical protein VMD08_15140, partial [Candidatus Baltobacteraceae bacterium]|nr:hypothetical protein [Candidatus Baltobacteraceae bacterium]